MSLYFSSLLFILYLRFFYPDSITYLVRIVMALRQNLYFGTLFLFLICGNQLISQEHSSFSSNSSLKTLLNHWAPKLKKWAKIEAFHISTLLFFTTLTTTLLWCTERKKRMQEKNRRETVDCLLQKFFKTYVDENSAYRIDHSAQITISATPMNTKKTHYYLTLTWKFDGKEYQEQLPPAVAEKTIDEFLKGNHEQKQ